MTGIPFRPEFGGFTLANQQQGPMVAGAPPRPDQQISPEQVAAAQAAARAHQQNLALQQKLFEGMQDQKAGSPLGAVIKALGMAYMGKKLKDGTGKTEGLLAEAMKTEKGYDRYEKQLDDVKQREREMEDFWRTLHESRKDKRQERKWSQEDAQKEHERAQELTSLKGGYQIAAGRAGNPGLYTGGGPMLVDPDQPDKGMWVPDGNGGFRIAPIPGELKQQTEDRKRRGREQRMIQTGGTVVADVGRGINLFKEEIGDRDGVINQNYRLARAKVPGTPEYRIQSFFESAKSNIGIDQIQMIRDNSETGGALGQIPVQQQKRLEQMLGQFDVWMNSEDLEQNILRLQKVYLEIMYGADWELQEKVAKGEISPEQAREFRERRMALEDQINFDFMGNPKPEQEAEESPEQAYQNWLKQNGLASPQG